MFSLRAPTHPTKAAKKLIHCFHCDNPHCHTNYKSYGTSPDKYKCRIQGNVCQFGQIIEGIFLCPGPHSNGQDSQTKKLQWKGWIFWCVLPDIITQKMTLKPKMTYLRQQDTSLVSLILLLLLCPWPEGWEEDGWWPPEGIFLLYRSWYSAAIYLIIVNIWKVNLKITTDKDCSLFTL